MKNLVDIVQLWLNLLKIQNFDGFQEVLMDLWTYIVFTSNGKTEDMTRWILVLVLKPYFFKWLSSRPRTFVN